MTQILGRFEDWQAWGRKVRQGQMSSQKRAYSKFYRGIKPAKIQAIQAKAAEKEPDAVSVAKKAEPAKPRDEGVSRSSGQENTQGFACPTCWAVPKMVRNDGFTIGRHLPADPDAKRYRDTEFCDGQGKIAVAVMDSGWSPGSEPRKKMSAKKWRLGNGRKT